MRGVNEAAFTVCIVLSQSTEQFGPLGSVSLGCRTEISTSEVVSVPACLNINQIVPLRVGVDPPCASDTSASLGVPLVEFGSECVEACHALLPGPAQALAGCLCVRLHHAHNTNPPAACSTLVAPWHEQWQQLVTAGAAPNCCPTSMRVHPRGTQ